MTTNHPLRYRKTGNGRQNRLASLWSRQKITKTVHAERKNETIWEIPAYVGKTQKNLVHRLKELRKIHGITQEQFSERTGISYKYYQAIETGVKKELRISTLERLAAAYGIEVWQLLAPSVPKTKITLKVKQLNK